MIDLLADNIRDPRFLTIYMVFAMAILCGPMVGLTVWYHRQAARSAGGRALMREQEKHNKGGHTLPGAAANLPGAAKMARDISKGVYGVEVRRQQNFTYLFACLWLVANVLVFGALIWAQDVNKQRDAARKAAVATEVPVRR
jgi:hypothetical protein